MEESHGRIGVFPLHRICAAATGHEVIAAEIVEDLSGRL